MGDYGIKISKEGFDVKTAADKDLVLTSKLDTIKIAKTIATQHNQSGASETLSIAHGLGYSPGYLFYVKNPEETSRWYGVVGESPVNAYRHWDLGTDATNLQIFLDAADTNEWNIKTFFLAEESQGSPTGNQTQENYGIKVSPPGVDVKSDIADSSFLLNTRMETIKIISIVDQTINYTSPGRTEVEVDHNMSFIPAFYGMAEFPFSAGAPFGTQYYTLPFIQVGAVEIGCYVTATKLGFFVEAVSNITVNFHVAILGNKIA